MCGTNIMSKKIVDLNRQKTECRRDKRDAEASRHDRDRVPRPMEEVFGSSTAGHWFPT